MQQKSLTHKTGSLSKILMGTAMIGFFGFFSSNAVADVDCESLHSRAACQSHSECGWLHNPETPDEGSCVGNYLHNMQ